MPYVLFMPDILPRAGGNPLGRPRGPRGRCGPTAPGTISGECALGGIRLRRSSPLARQLRLGTGPAVATRTARLLGTNRGFDARLSGGGSYEHQRRCAFFALSTRKYFRTYSPSV